MKGGWVLQLIKLTGFLFFFFFAFRKTVQQTDCSYARLDRRLATRGRQKAVCFPISCQVVRIKESSRDFESDCVIDLFLSHDLHDYD